jgi:hypothetical protein
MHFSKEIIGILKLGFRCRGYITKTNPIMEIILPYLVVVALIIVFWIAFVVKMYRKIKGL